MRVTRPLLIRNCSFIVAPKTVNLNAMVEGYFFYRVPVRWWTQ